MPKKRKVKKAERMGAGAILKATFKGISIGFSVLSTIIFILIFFSIISLFVGEPLQTGNVAIIPINGIITPDSSGGGLASPLGTSATKTLELIEKAVEKEEIKAIILEINSPGGTPVASDEIARAIKEANKTTVAVIRETGASGAFWIATAADRVLANRMSVTGSIGVKSSYLEVEGLLDDFNVTYRQLIAGKYKDIGTPYKEMTKEEQMLFQKILDKLHNEFIEAVAENRNMPVAKVKKLATGMIYLGSEAKDLGLIDAIGGKKEALEYIEDLHDIEAETVLYKQAGGLFGSLGGLSTDLFYQVGRGIGSTLNQDPRPSFT